MTRARPNCTTCGEAVPDRWSTGAKCQPCRRDFNRALLLRAYGDEIRLWDTRADALIRLNATASLFSAWWSGRSSLTPADVETIEEHAAMAATQGRKQVCARARAKKWKRMRRGELESPDGKIWALRRQPMSGAWTPYEAGTRKRIGDTDYHSLVELVAAHG